MQQGRVDLLSIHGVPWAENMENMENCSKSFTHGWNAACKQNTLT